MTLSRIPRGQTGRPVAAGFVITVETLLLITLFLLPLLLGGILLARKLGTLYLDRREYSEVPYSRATVFDSSGPTAKILGPVIGYDPYESPLVIFRDDATKAGVILGVRTDRLTSYAQVFYTDSACTMTPRIRSYDATVGTGDVAPLYSYLPSGVAFQMQGIAYAMGNGNILYRSTTATGASVTSAADLYVWTSQDIAPSSAAPSPPCALVPSGVTIENLVTPVSVIDFDTVYTAPFKAAFPTPSSTAAPSFCSSGEC